LIFKTLASCSTLSPIIVFDEIDKLSIHKDYSPFSTFHQLLEPENSASIYDEFLELEFNGSFIIYILTANNKHTIPESLLSRMTVIEIQNPDVQQMKIISQKIFIELLAGSKLFKEKLSEDVLNYLSQFSPREVYQILSKNLFQLSTNQRKKFKNDFFVIPEKKKEYKIGF
jgi:ATP-dependent Lon protease